MIDTTSKALKSQKSDTKDRAQAQSKPKIKPGLKQASGQRSSKNVSRPARNDQIKKQTSTKKSEAARASEQPLVERATKGQTDLSLKRSREQYDDADFVVSEHNKKIIEQQHIICM